MANANDRKMVDKMLDFVKEHPVFVLAAGGIALAVVLCVFG